MTMTPTQAHEYLAKNGRTGDVLAFAGNWAVSDAINVCTGGIPRWDISHVGILCEVGSELLLFQSLAFPGQPCHIQGKLVKGTQAQLASESLADGSKVWHYPLYRDLYPHESTRLRAGLLADIGKPYDTVGAIQAGGLFLLPLLDVLFKQESKAQLCCSAWVAEALCDTGIFPTANYLRWSPNSFIRRAKMMGILRKPVRVA